MNINNDECSICLGNLSIEQGLLTCGHYFCLSCITNWFSKSKNTLCPFCNQSHKNNNIYKCENASSIKTSILDCLAYLRFTYIPIKQISNDMEKLGTCLFCTHLCGFLFECISTETKEIQQEYFCSRCAKTVYYIPESQQIKGDVDVFLNRLEYFNSRITKAYSEDKDNGFNYTQLEGHYDYNRYGMKDFRRYRYKCFTEGKPNFIPSNYELIHLFHRKSDNILKTIITNLFIGWDTEKGHYINSYDVDRLYMLLTSSIEDQFKSSDLMEHYFKTVGPFIISWNKCKDFQSAILKAIKVPAFGTITSDNSELNIQKCVKFIYCLRKGVFKHFVWGYNADYIHNSNFSNILYK